MGRTAVTGLELKQKNRNNIYRCIHEHDRVTKQGIMHLLALSLPTVTQNIDDLIAEGLIEENGSFGNTGGRRAIGYSIVKSARVALGMELSQRHIGIAMIDLSGQVIDYQRIYYAYQKEESYYRYAADLLLNMIQKNKILNEQILGAGISMQGVPSEDGQTIRYGTIMDNTGEPVTVISRFLPFPCRFFHDADSGAFAELWIRPELTNAVYVSLSTHLGISVIIDRKLYGGASGFGGKIEHTTLVPDGRLCYCGQKGCADTYCATIILANSVPEGRLEPFFQMLKDGSPKQNKVWAEYMEYLSILLHNIRTTFESDLILGGYMSRYLPDYLDELKGKVYERDTFIRESDYLSIGKFQDEVTAAGSALQLIEQFIEQI